MTIRVILISYIITIIVSYIIKSVYMYFLYFNKYIYTYISLILNVQRLFLQKPKVLIIRKLCIYMLPQSRYNYVATTTYIRNCQYSASIDIITFIDMYIISVIWNLPTIIDVENIEILYVVNIDVRLMWIPIV